MAKIVQVLTRPSEQYDLPTAEAQVRDLDGIIQKLNTTFQEGRGGRGQDFTGGRFDRAGSREAYDRDPTGFSGSS